jgi:hypothetical protein
MDVVRRVLRSLAVSGGPARYYTKRYQAARTRNEAGAERSHRLNRDRPEARTALPAALATDRNMT